MRYKYQSGGQINKKELLASFLQTLSPEEQDQFIDEFQQLSPEEQESFYSELLQRMQQQQPQQAQPAMQEGGLTQPPNVEVEGGETTLLPDGKLEKFTGKKHKDGGIKTNLPEGSYVFSEHLKVPPELAKQILGKETKKKYTYAELSKKFPTKPFTDVLEHPDSDQIQRETATIKLNTHNAMLETLFSAQEMDKGSKGKSNDYEGQLPMAQEGRKITDLYPEAKMNSTEGFDLSAYSNRFKAIDRPNTYYDPETKKFFYRTNSGLYKESLKEGTEPIFKKQTIPNVNDLPRDEYGRPVVNGRTTIKGQSSPNDLYEHSSAVDEFGQPNFLPIGKPGLPEFDLVLPDEGQPAVAPVPAPVPKKSGTKPAPVQKRTPWNVPTIPGLNLPTSIGNRGMDDVELSSLTEDGPYISEATKELARPESDSVDYPGKEKKEWWKDLGIDRKLAGSIFDSLMAASNRLNVDNPQYRDNRKYPLFSRFVDFDDKEVGRTYNSSMQQILNSNVPQQVKDAQIAQLNAKLQDYQAKIDMGNAQRYQQKIDTDTGKLQQYLDYNVDQSVKDLETYREKKARIDYLRDQFNAQRKAGIINPWRQYFDYVQETALENQIYSDNYNINPVTGKVVYKGQKKDGLEDTQNLMAQFAQNKNNTFTTAQGSTITPMGPNSYLIESPDGKTQFVTIDGKQSERDRKIQAYQERTRR